MTEGLIGIGVTLIALSITVLLNIIQKNRRKKLEGLEKKYIDKINKRADDYFKVLLVDDDVKSTEWTYYLQDTISSYQKYLSSWIIHTSTGTPETSIEEKIDEKLEEIKERIEKVEQRFPQESTIDKIASVNDAILGTTVETLSESIKRIEDKMLTKWDVAKIFFQIIAALGVIIGIMFTVIKII